MEKYDCIIIGGGIAGITAGIYLKNANKKVLLIEKGTMGGILNKISKIENYPGFKSIEGPDLASRLYDQVKDTDLEILLDTVIKIEHENDTNIVTLKDKTFEAKYLILATGKDARKLELPNEDELIGHGVSYCALCDGALFKDKEVVVIGAGESALHEALYLSSLCKKVTIINKYPAFKTKEGVVSKILKKANVEIVYNALTKSLNTTDNKLTSITVLVDETLKEIKTEGVFVYIGSTPNIFNDIDLELDGKYLKVNEDCETSIDSIYAVGDVIKKDYYQLINAASEGMTAATNIIKRLNKE